MEYLTCPCSFEIKNQRDDEGTIFGYGSTFDNVDSYGDTVSKGAFSKTIADASNGNAPWPAMLSNHGADQNPIGIWTDMSEDDRGLKLKGKLALNTKKGIETYNLLKMKPRPALNGLSIGYRAKDFELHKSGLWPEWCEAHIETSRTCRVQHLHFPG